MKFLVLMLLCVPGLALAAAESSSSSSAGSNSATSSGSSSSFSKKIYARVGITSSKAMIKSNFRNMKSLISDDSSGGGGSDLTSSLNRSYASTLFTAQPWNNHQFAMIGQFGLDSRESRQISMPMGPKFVMPGRIIGARYRYMLSEKYYLSAGGVHINTMGFKDPSVGAGFINVTDTGNLYRASLSFAVPTTKKSYEDHLITRTTLRTSAMVHSGRFTHQAGASYSRPFYQSRPASSPTSPVIVAPMPPLASLGFSELDLVLLQRESSRTVGILGTSYTLKKFRFSTSGGISYLTTNKGNHIWVTNYKPLGVGYSNRGWDINMDFGLLSDIQKYQSPSLPKYWNITMGLAYSFGQGPVAI